MSITKQWNVTIPKDLLVRLRKLSQDTGRPMAWYVVRGLNAIMPKYEKAAAEAAEEASRGQ